MNRLATEPGDRIWHYEPWVRDQWLKSEAAALPAGSWVLDAGAGASKYRPYFAHCRYETQDFCKYEGSEPFYLEPINYVCDILAIPLPDGCLDAIVCTEVIEHVLDPMEVLREFARLLKPRGRLFMTAPLLSSMHMAPFHYYGGFTSHWYRHWLPATGFSVDSIQPVGGPGRTCVVYFQTWYTAWAEKEKTLGLGARLASLAFRALWKVPAHWLLPRLLPKLDPWLGGAEVCSGYLVSATRLAEQPNSRIE